MLSSILNWWLGPRVWSVFKVRDLDANTGWTFVATTSEAWMPKRRELIRSGLRLGAAQRLARSLRHQAENKVEGIL